MKKHVQGICGSLVIKGNKEEIEKALNDAGWNLDIKDEAVLNNDIYRVRIPGDVYINTKSLVLDKFTNLKYILFMHPERSYTDVVVFKDFGSTEHISVNAYVSDYGTLWAEELEGCLFFPDEDFKIEYEDFSCGEMATLEYKCVFKPQWEDDSKFTRSE